MNTVILLIKNIIDGEIWEGHSFFFHLNYWRNQNIANFLPHFKADSLCKVAILSWLDCYVIIFTSNDDRNVSGTWYTVKPVNAVTSIKQSPVLKGHWEMFTVYIDS
jgi:hypothetical protein